MMNSKIIERFIIIELVKGVFIEKFAEAKITGSGSGYITTTDIEKAMRFPVYEGTFNLEHPYTVREILKQSNGRTVYIENKLEVIEVDR